MEKIFYPGNSFILGNFAILFLCLQILIMSSCGVIRLQLKYKNKLIQKMEYEIRECNAQEIIGIKK